MLSVIVNSNSKTKMKNFMEILKLSSYMENTNDIDKEDYNSGDKGMDKS